jgi:hypothetical protein
VVVAAIFVLDLLRVAYELKFLLLLNLWNFFLLLFLSYFSRKKGSIYFRHLLTFEPVDRGVETAQSLQRRGTGLKMGSICSIENSSLLSSKAET